MKKLRTAILFGLIFAIMLSMARFEALCTDLRHNVLRLHIIANSDNETDQALKLLVRDAILNEYGQAFKVCGDLNESIQFANENIENIKTVAEDCLKENGCIMPVSVSVGSAYFENRDYDSFTLPAGQYEAVNIIIGEGQGKNWWCVMFPAVCIGAAGKLDDSTSADSADMAQNSSSYKIRFKTVEIYERIRKNIAKK